MRRIILTLTASMTCLIAMAQEADSIFNRTIYNNEYDLYITMNLYDKDVLIRGQEFMGALDGYLGDFDDFRKWLIVASTLADATHANLQIINTEGSEDLRATLTYNPNGTYTLHQTGGSALKIARRQKWVKLPKSLTFTTTRTPKEE